MTFEIDGRPIGPGHPVYVVAELSANHGQRFDDAERLVRAAASAGADAVKIQTYTPDTLTIDVRTGPFVIGRNTIWKGQVLYDLYRDAQTPWEWHRPLQSLARSLGLQFFSTPFDATAVDFLESLDVPAYKIASFELVDIPLLGRVAATGKPVILSTGMATFDEIDEAVKAIRGVRGAGPIALLRTNSAYPAPPEEMNLRTIPRLVDVFGVVAGLSDHTLSAAVPVAAVAQGACIIEKHLTLSRSVPGPDAAFSLEPSEFLELVDSIRTTERALGQAQFGPTDTEKPSLAFRRSLYVVARIRAGQAFTEENVRSIRPGGGLHPRHLREVLGRRASRDLERGKPLVWEDLE